MWKHVMNTYKFWRLIIDIFNFDVNCSWIGFPTVILCCYCLKKKRKKKEILFIFLVKTMEAFKSQKIFWVRKDSNKWKFSHALKISFDLQLYEPCLGWFWRCSGFQFLNSLISSKNSEHQDQTFYQFCLQSQITTENQLRVFLLHAM